MRYTGQVDLEGARSRSGSRSLRRTIFDTPGGAVLFARAPAPQNLAITAAHHCEAGLHQTDSGCADRVFSRHGPGYACCRTTLQRCCDTCRRPHAHRAREEPRSTVRVAVWIARERQDLAHARSWLATAVAQRTPARRSRRQTTTWPRSGWQRPALLLTRHGGRPRQCAALHASRRRRGEPDQPRHRSTAETLRHC
ncbi:hypothetical protein ACVWZM_005539 [Bradyrhizobium sp. USDA 4501]